MLNKKTRRHDKIVVGSFYFCVDGIGMRVRNDADFDKDNASKGYDLEGSSCAPTLSSDKVTYAEDARGVVVVI